MFAPPPAAKKNETPRASQPAPARVPSVPTQPPKQQQPALKSPSLVKSQAPAEPEQNGGESTGPQQQATQRTAATRAAPAPVASSPKVVTDSSVQVKSPRGAARFRSLLGTNLIMTGLISGVCHARTTIRRTVPPTMPVKSTARKCRRCHRNATGW
jgi:hypothetical protein